MTALGASIIVPEAISAMAEIASHWVEMDDLQRAASTVVARLTGGETGFITACCASGLTLAIAGAMTGPNLLALERPAFMRLIRQPATIARIEHMLETGKPLRN